MSAADLQALRPASAGDMVVPRGVPETLLRQALDLATVGESLRAMGSILSGLTTSEHWSGPAATAFVAQVAPLPPTLLGAASRYTVCARATTTYAATLQQCQAAAGSAVDEYVAQWDAAVRWGDARVVAETSASPQDQADAEVFHRREVEALTQAKEARSRWARAVEVWREADRDCARVLEACSEDALTDSGLYRVLGQAISVLDGVAAASGVVASVPGPWMPAAEVVSDGSSALALGAAAGVAVGYGDVSGRELAVRAGETIAPAVLTRVFRSAGVARSLGGESLGGVARLRIGAAATVGRTPQGVVVPRPRPASPLPRGLRVRDRLTLKAMDAVNRAYLHDLRIATGNGPLATRALVTSWVLRDAATIDKRLGRAERARDSVEAEVDQALHPDQERDRPAAGTGGPTL